MNTGQSAGSFNSHTKTITALAPSPMQYQFASGSKDRTVYLWDTRTRLPIGTSMIGHEGEITSIAFSPGGERVASMSSNSEIGVSASSKSTVRVWDTRMNGWINQRSLEHKITNISYSPNGQCIAAGSEDWKIYCWDTWTLDTLGRLWLDTKQPLDASHSLLTAHRLRRVQLTIQSESGMLQVAT
jgi:WD40 repeat protein